ncbi:MAG: hypothetical protein K8L91_28240 [Anaerolineae bacterium]|nr:hypothetical protein [Anaerolineae bacterium]
MKPSYRLVALILIVSAALSASRVIAQDDDPAAQWKRQAEDALSLEILPDYDPDNPLPPEIAPIYRTRVVAYNYYQMYEVNPAAFKWAGLAALVSCGIFTSLEASIGQTAPPPFDQLPTLLTDGNLAVYSDLYWQHLAFADGGLEEMERLYELGALEEWNIEVWRMIADGLENDDPDPVWEGNTALLHYEQEIILQPLIYDGYEAMWGILEKLPGAIVSSVPNDTTPFDADAGDFANFDDRWAFIADHIFPAWREFEDTPNALNDYLKAFNVCWIPEDNDPRRD